MKKNDHSGFSEPTRQPILSIAVLLFDSFKGIIRGFWPLLLIVFLGKSSSASYLLLLGSIGIAGMSFAISFLRYYRFQFHLDKEELVIERGIVTRIRTNVPFDRVQSIDFEQKIIHRFLNLVSFKVTTAGSKNSDIEIPALEVEQANALREAILSRQSKKVKTTSKVLSTEDEAPKLLFKLKILDLLKVGISVNHIRTAGIILALAWGLYTQVGEIKEEYSFENTVEEVAVSMNFDWIYWILILAPAFFLVAFITSLGLAVIRFFNLQVLEKNKGLLVLSGLFSRRQQTALKTKLQIFTWVTNPVRQLFKMFNIRLKQASSDEVGAKQAIVIPGCYADQRDMIRNWFFPDFHEDFHTMGVEKELVIRYTLFMAVIPSVVISIIGVVVGNYSLILSLLWIPTAYFLFSIYRKKWKLSFNDQYLLAERGIFGLKSDTMYLYKIQSVAIIQSPYQRRHQLASLNIYTAAGNILVPYMKDENARFIADYLLYRAEVSNKKWM